MNLTDFIDEVGITPGAIYATEAGKPIKDSIIAVAAFPTGLFGGWGSSFGTPTPVVLTGATIADVLVAEALKSNVYFWGNTTVNGSKPMSTPKKYAKKFGTEVMERETGERNEIVNLEVISYIPNIEAFERFVQAASGYDFIFFTNATAIWVRNIDNTPIVHTYGYEITGNADTTGGTGKFSVSWYSELGDLPHQAGVTLAKISASRVKFTFDTAVLTNATKEACGGGKERYKRTAAGAVTITRDIVETAACVRWELKPISANAVTNIANATIDPVTGIVTILTGMPAGTYDFQVVAVNQVGVFGSYSFTFVAA